MNHKPRISNFKWVIMLPLFLICARANSQIVLTLTPSYYGANHNISCFGKNDGYINVTISGGATPYTFRWSNNATTQNLTTLPAGYYSVVATDRNGVTKASEITLVEPRDLGLSANPYSYPNGYNISLFGSCNGMITVTTTDGVPPYTYLWSDGNTSQSRTALCKGSYVLTVTDANNCHLKSDVLSMIEPERSDWTMTGNAGTNPATQFIGTSDNVDLVFKTNTIDRLRIMSNGGIKIPSLAGSGNSIILSDMNGQLSKQSIYIPTTSQQCLDPFTFLWQFKTNVTPNIAYTCSNFVGIGTDDPQSNLGVNGSARFFNFNNHSLFMDVGDDGMHGILNCTDEILINYNSGKNVSIGGPGGNSNLTVEGKINSKLDATFATSSGKVGIGISNPITDKLEVWGGNIFVGGNQFQSSNDFAAIYFGDINHYHYIKAVFGGGLHFGTIGAPDAMVIEQNTGKVIIGAGLTLNSNTSNDYGLYVGKGILTEKIKVAVHTTGDWSDKVFEKCYNLKSLSDVEVYINKHKHLPEVPSANEVVKNGFDVAEMNAKLLQKIEELTLYLIDQQKQIEILKNEITTLNNH